VEWNVSMTSCIQRIYAVNASLMIAATATVTQNTRHQPPIVPVLLNVALTVSPGVSIVFTSKANKLELLGHGELTRWNNE
jgi:energy-converting hydrogenase Eha subunit E